MLHSFDLYLFYSVLLCLSKTPDWSNRVEWPIDRQVKGEVGMADREREQKEKSGEKKIEEQDTEEHVRDLPPNYTASHTVTSKERCTRIETGKSP